ncbi:hypothetical protein FQV26_12995 [Planococcus sp. CPCC 101016]|uniref:hypothetical protein n=1 Tax=Planococcus sp. CPCC 101016 TaxID=2599617 RepID=UPI0011B47AFE|nr:hypothetical protein [Planococcus sp. CPCC 101016]TWT05354.1 hypothetical protein FQV26_12995 [Planococcus sp. CPCC 101016]
MNNPNRFGRPKPNFKSSIRTLPGFQSNNLWKKVLVTPVYLLIAVILLAGLFGGGISSIINLVVFAAVIIAVVALFKGSLPRFKIPNRKVAVVILVAALALSFL